MPSTKFVVVSNESHTLYAKAHLGFKVQKSDAATGEPILGTLVGHFTNRDSAQFVADSLNETQVLPPA